MLWLLAGLACEDRLGFDAVSLYPTNGWVDGCTQVRMGGHGFTDDFSATIGGNPIQIDPDRPDPESEPLDVGFEKYGTAPAGAQGFADYKATDSGESVTVTNAFYYVACPGAPYLESVSAVDGTVTITGCGFDAANTTAYLAPKGKLPDPKVGFQLDSQCGSAIVSFGTSGTPGVYELYLSLDGGVTFIPDPACLEDSADTAVTCPPPPIVTIKGGA